MKNVKYMVFITMLSVMGLIFFYREQLTAQLEKMMQLGLESYEASIDLPQRTDAETDAEKTAENAAENAGTETAENTETEGTDKTGAEETMEAVENKDKQPAWEYETATADYFDDALFIGDSRTVGLCDYAGLDNATFYASTGLTVYKIFSAEIVPVKGSRQKQTIEEALTERQFSKIYLMIGINEMGTGTVDTFMEKYKEVVAHLQELEPDAILYLQAIMRVSKERSSKGDYINNEGIDERNAEIAKLADNEKIFYLDVNPLVCDEEGGLISEYTFDGVHLRAAYIGIWKQFLMEHTVKFL